MKKNNTALRRIAILTCWYGNYPWYLPYFIHSCSYNPTIDFIIITDNTEPIPNKPRNVKVVQKTLEQLKKRASKKLGFTVNIDYPYKLCDFKPAYGFFFPEIIKKYDFWGHGDLDVIYGNIRNFMTADILDKHDVISSRHDYITGTFCLFRNNEQMNTLFMQSRDYEEVFSSPDHYCFDECNFLFKELQNGGNVLDYPDNIQSMTWVVKAAEKKKKLKAFFDFLIVEGTPGHLMWDKGKIIYKNQYEAMFYHLITFKTECRQRKILNPVPEVFYITDNKILAKKP